MNKTLEQRIIQLEHLLEIMLKNQEAIKSHLWSKPSTKKPVSQLEFQEKEAINYVDKVILPKSQQIGIQGFWQGAVLNYLQQQALNFIGSVLRKLVIEKMVDLADWLLENLQDYLLEQYEKASENEKELFKQKILEKFPDSKLAKELSNHE